MIYVQLIYNINFPCILFISLQLKYFFCYAKPPLDIHNVR